MSHSPRSTGATSRSRRPGTGASPRTRPGYGFLAEDIPELSIGVYPEFRGQRVGSLLLGALIARARRDGERALCLSVNRENSAKRLYARYGFEVVGEPGDALTMGLELT